MAKPFLECFRSEYKVSLSKGVLATHVTLFHPHDDRNSERCSCDLRERLESMVKAAGDKDSRVLLDFVDTLPAFGEALKWTDCSKCGRLKLNRAKIEGLEA